MTVFVLCIAILATLSMVVGFYFRIAESDIKASSRVWKRIRATVDQMVEDDDWPDVIVRDVTLFSAIAGCGCFAGSIVRNAVGLKLSGKTSFRRERVEQKIRSLSPERLQELGELMRDLVLYDSLHSPVIGRICRMLHRQKFDQRSYRAPQVEVSAVTNAVMAAELTAARQKEHGRLPADLMPA